MVRKTIDEFIFQAKQVHGNRYDYSKTKYKNNKTKIIIICSEHGEFFQNPKSHLYGHGCFKCFGNKRKTNKEFIQDAIKIHGNKYDYSKIEYKNNKTKITIICREHGEFSQKAENHLGNHGCPMCMRKLNIYSRKHGKIKIDNDMFIKEARKVHKNRYDYSKTDCNKSKITIICRNHGEFSQNFKSHLNGSGCPKCGKTSRNRKKRIGKDEFIRRSREAHGDKYDYSKVKYINGELKVIIICPIHGEFEQNAKNHFNGHECFECKGTKKSNTKEFIKKSRKIHGNKYDYSKVEYKNNRIEVIIICEKHGEFSQAPHDHLIGRGCVKCNHTVSKASQEWLDMLGVPKEYREKSIRLKNGKMVRVDALDKKKKIVYEYDHFFWHGKDDMDLNKKHPISGIKYKKLYERTLKRREAIINSGYFIIYTYGDG